MQKSRPMLAAIGRLLLFKAESVQGLGIVLDGKLLHVADGPAGEHQLHIIVAYGQGDGIVLDVDNGAIDAANGADPVAVLQVGQHVFNLLVLLPLGTDEKEIEHNENQNHGQQAAQQADDGGSTGKFFGSGGVGGGGSFSHGGGNAKKLGEIHG